MKKGGYGASKAPKVGKSGKDMFTGDRSGKTQVSKPGGYGGMKNSTYIRPQPN